MRKGNVSGVVVHSLDHTPVAVKLDGIVLIYGEVMSFILRYQISVISGLLYDRHDLVIRDAGIILIIGKIVELSVDHMGIFEQSFKLFEFSGGAVFMV